VRLVLTLLVPVIVIDRKGHHVGGLSESAFQIYEDSVPQRIVSFAEQTPTSSTASFSAARTEAGGGAMSKPGAGANTSSLGVPASKRTYVICVDTLHTSFASFERARASLGKLFDREQETGAQFALISLGRQLQVVQTATADASAIRAKINSKVFVATFSQMEASDFLGKINDVKTLMESFCQGCGSACGRGASTRRGACDATLQGIRIDLDARSQRWEIFSNAFLSGFERMVEELAKIDGARTILLVSDGFTLKPGAELYAVASAYVPNSPYFKFDPPHNLQPALDGILRTAARSNILVYTIDTRGVYSPAFLPGGSSDVSGTQINPRRGGSVLGEMDSKRGSVAFQNTSVLSQLAAATGGLFLHTNNDLLQQFRNVLADGENFYILAYTSTNSATDGTFRRILVKVKGKQGGVRAKLGYWAEQPPSK
jgi:VWFA-related protein